MVHVTNHDTEAQAERTCQESITILDAKVASAWEYTHGQVDVDDAGANDAGYGVISA
jgi:hypothetical protein